MTAAHPPALQPSRDARVDLTTKGFPTVDGSISLAEVGGQGWTLTDLVPPVLVLRETALAHNIALMAEYCSTHGVELAPHGKTTMAPQLWRRQLDAGAWGIGAATVAHARVMLAAGVLRVLIANEVTDAPAVRWIADRLLDPASRSLRRRFLSRGGAAGGGALSTARPLPVLVELGHREGGPDAAASRTRSRCRVS